MTETFSFSPDPVDIESSISIWQDSRLNHTSQYNWEKFSNGFASKQMDKMGYKGKGLGKRENGITEPIEFQRKCSFKQEIKNKSGPENNQTFMYILSDSIFNQLDQKHIAKGKEVKIMCHGRCTIQCMYKHLALPFKLNPKYLLLHISTNDSKDI